MSTCEFCDEFSNGRKNTFIRHYGSAFDRVILATERFRIIPSLGQITQGHLLVVPVKHFCAMCDLPDEHIEELENLCVYVRSTLKETYGACIFFEHGMRNSGSGGCGIDHAHMHAVPVTAEGMLKILRQKFGGSGINTLAEIEGDLDQNSSYLFFENSSAKRYVFPVSNLPSQYMRKLVAESIGKNDWDWRECGHEPELISTVQRLSSLISPVTTTHK